MAQAITPIPPLPGLPEDPSELGWPWMLPLEIALNTNPVRQVCSEHGVSIAQYRALCQNPLFRKRVSHAKKMLETDPMGFKVRAQFQSGELLKTMWKWIHDDSPAAKDVPWTVKADLAKFIIRAAGLDESASAARAGAVAQAGFHITLNLGSSGKEPTLIEASP